MSLGVRLRRGAWGEGSRAARALAVACLAAGAIALVLPSSAAAYPCGERRAPQSRELMSTSVSIDECRAPEQPRETRPARTRKRGSVSGLTVFVLALGAALLIPIGRNGLPHGGDPFGHDPTRERPSPGSR
jgi:hypothetical protein